MILTFRSVDSSTCQHRRFVLDDVSVLGMTYEHGDVQRADQTLQLGTKAFLTWGGRNGMLQHEILSQQLSRLSKQRG